MPAVADALLQTAEAATVSTNKMGLRPKMYQKGPQTIFKATLRLAADTKSLMPTPAMALDCELAR